MNYRDIDPKEVGAIIRAARERRAWSQIDLARRIGIKQSSIQSVETGETARSKFLPEIAKELQIPPVDLGLPEVTVAAPAAESTSPEVADGYGPRDFQIYSAAEGGPGEIIRSTDAVDWWPRPSEVARAKAAYGLYVVGESMIPDFAPGHVAVINPNLPHIGGKAYIFYAEEPDGSVRATIKRLRRQTGDTWFVTQHNPPPGQKTDFTLPRKLWRIAHRIVGRQEPS